MKYLITALLLTGLSTSSITSSAHAEEVKWRELTTKEKNAIEEVVKQELKDPQSAKFKWEKYGASVRMYCGLVNAKNSFGGYAGDSGFSVFLDIGPDGAVTPAPSRTLALIDPDTPAGTAQMRACVNHGYFQ